MVNVNEEPAKLCPLWSIFWKKEFECIGEKCGMSYQCGFSLPEHRPFDECHKGHRKAADITTNSDPEGKRVFMCLEEGCDERWMVQEKDMER